MSGRKYSQVELAATVREAIACRLAAEVAASRAASLVEALAAAADGDENLRPSLEQARGALNAVQEQLASMRDGFDQEHLMALDLSDVRRRRYEVQAISGRIEEVAQRCRNGADAAATRAELAAVLDQLDRGRGELEPWLADVYAGYEERTRALLAKLDDEIRRTGGAQSSAALAIGHAAEFDAMRATASARRTQAAERDYIAQALRTVCTTELGFGVKELPQQGPLDDLVLEVDTFAYGLIQFRLQLDGTIRSQSELVEASCPANFGVIEEKLKGLGVVSAFRYEHNQTPVRLEKGAKELPGSEPPGASLRTGRG